jgi:hypothetical protein
MAAAVPRTMERRTGELRMVVRSTVQRVPGDRPILQEHRHCPKNVYDRFVRRRKEGEAEV